MPPGPRPKPLLLSVPIADDPLGEWEDGQFKFKSPAAESQWKVDAYRRGVSSQDWHRGTPLDDRTRDLVLNDLGGATAPIFRGPDGQYRFANVHTIEPPEIRDHRLRALRGARIDDLAGPEMPGERELAPRVGKPLAQVPASANDNARPSGPSAPAAQAQDKKPALSGIGRFAYMAEAQKNADHPTPGEILQHIDDGIRLLGNGLTLGYADNIAAGGNAVFGENGFGEDYERFLGEEKARTAAARDRSGVVGALVESAPQLIPGAGDLLGLGGDIQMYINDPTTRTLANAGKTLAGLLPIVPSLASTIKRVDGAVDGALHLEKVPARIRTEAEGVAETTKADAGGISGMKADEITPPAFDVDDPAAIDAYLMRPIKGNEGPDGHVLSKHVGKTEAELRARYGVEAKIAGSSSFPDAETADRVVQSGLQQNKAAILNWMKDPGQSRLYVPYRGTTPIGMTILKDGTVVPKTDALIGLRKDGKGGFYFFTAYPK